MSNHRIFQTQMEETMRRKTTRKPTMQTYPRSPKNNEKPARKMVRRMFIDESIRINPNHPWDQRNLRALMVRKIRRINSPVEEKVVEIPFWKQGFQKHAQVVVWDFWTINSTLQVLIFLICTYMYRPLIHTHTHTQRPSKGVKFQPPGLFLVVKGLKFQTLGGFKYLRYM